MVTRIFTAVLAAVFLLSNPVSAQQKRFNQKEMEALLIIISNDTGRLGENYQDTYGVTKARAKVMADHYKATMADPKTRSAMAKAMVASMRGVQSKTPQQAEAIVRSRVNGAMLKMGTDGLKRMNKSSQLGFLKATYPIFVKSTTANCAALFGYPKTTISNSEAEVSTYNKLSTKQLATYLLFYRKAIEFSANNRGRPVKLKRTERKQIEALFARNIGPLILRHKNSSGILKAIGGDPSAQPKDYCDFGRMLMKFIVNAPEETGGLLARYILLES